jgi:signal transduction histidine kinase
MNFLRDSWRLTRGPALRPRENESGMLTLVRVLAIGFAAVIVLLVAAALIGVNNARSNEAAAGNLVYDQLVVARLLDDVEREQEVLNTIFYRLTRTPEIVDRERVLEDLDQTDRKVEDLAKNARTGPAADDWSQLYRAIRGFSLEARRLLRQKTVTPDTSRYLFIRHEEVTAEVAKLVDLSEQRGIATFQLINRRTSRLGAETWALVGGCLAVALGCAFFTVRIAARVFRKMEVQASELSRVSFHMLELQESVARRFSHELHDELGGSLTAIKTNLAVLAADGLESGARARVEDCNKLVDESIANVRELSQLLRPTILDDFGLDAGLRWLIERFRERTDIGVDYVTEFQGRLPDETETHLFRIVQEALTNIARHSGATQVAIHLRANDGRVRLTLSDNGRGIAPGTRPGMGLSGMRARARSAGGELTFVSVPGKGVRIEAWAPQKAGTEAAQTIEAQ